MCVGWPLGPSVRSRFASNTWGSLSTRNRLGWPTAPSLECYFCNKKDKDIAELAIKADLIMDENLTILQANNVATAARSGHLNPPLPRSQRARAYAHLYAR